MGCSNVTTPVFIDTNLGTHLALPVSPDITANDFKRDLEGMHLSCFPEFGSIRVNALMVKRKSHYYHLSESLPLKYAFLGSNVTWFLHINVHPRSIRDHAESLKCNEDEVHNLESTANVDSVDRRTKCKRKKVKTDRFPHLKASVLKVSAVVCFPKRKMKTKKVKMREVEVKCSSKKGDENVIADAEASTSETFSEPASVSGIIKKYFTDYDEVASSYTTVQSRHREWLNGSRNERQYLNYVWSPQVSSKEKCSKPEVGKRLLLASDGLGLTQCNKQPVLSLCKYVDGKSPLHKSSGPVRNLAYEMTEDRNVQRW